MYPAIVDGTIATRRKLRLCESHFAGYLDHLRASAQNDQTDFESAKQPPCYLCSKPVADDPAQMFVTVYDLRAERQDWWAPLHHDCVEGAMEDWLIDASMA
jgi:hypothetical protein